MAPHARSKYPKPIYTLRLKPASHVYFINSIDLIPIVQRHFRTLSFDPPIIDGVHKILGVSQNTLDIMNQDVVADGDASYLTRLNKAVHSLLSPGPMLADMNKKAVSALEQSISELVAQGPTAVDMLDWVQRTVMGATTDSVFGPRNPFRDPDNVAAWIEFEREGMPRLAMGASERFIPAAIRARETLFKAFDKYLADDSVSEASTFFQRRIGFHFREGIPRRDISKLAVADNIAFSSNLVPTAFWLLYHIYADLTVLAECRSEVAEAVNASGNNNSISHSTTQTISYEYIKNSCPILQSTLKEVFRHHGVGLVPRRALSELMLDNKYLIKKGGLILIPYTVQHQDPANWGPNPEQFRHRRHLKPDSEDTLSEFVRPKQHEGAALRGFGYGAHLCPGRHLATAELLLFTALIMLRFDIRPFPDGSEWPKLEPSEAYQVAALGRPDHDVRIEFRPRPGVSQEGWVVDFS
ncbi:hypothetical protein MFIFM68171_02079 [Madurella fahalii]|uniref:Cytochrome P450 n=1 Tax=Madurella fahalii TaxID=1157608 RepID=A0ABQ0G296_9PEZI